MIKIYSSAGLILLMVMMFLAPPYRRPYELYYFCTLTKDVIIIIDQESYSEYSDFYDNEFGELNYQFHFVRVSKTIIGKFLRGGSTAALITYDDIELSKIIRDKNPDTIITVEVSTSLSAQASHLCSKYALRHIVIVWDNLKNSAFSYIPPYSIYANLVKSTAHKFIAVSNKSKEALVSWHVCEDKVEVIYPGIFVNKFKQNVDNAKEILFVGELEPIKGVHILLQAFKKLATHFHDVELILAGKGSLEREIIKLRENGLKINYKGYVAHTELNEVYSSCSIFCSPGLKKRAKLILTWEEQFGFTLVEAMASGLPIVTSRIGTIPEIVGEQNLVVIPSIDSVYSSLTRLLTSDDLRKQLREFNRLRSFSRYNALTQSLLFKKAINT